MTLDQVTQFNSSTGATIHLKNKGTGLISDGDLQLTNGKQVLWLNNLANPLCAIGQSSESDPLVAHFSGSQPSCSLKVSNWENVSINGGLSVDATGLTTMKGCLMEPGTGCVLNTQQVSSSAKTLSLKVEDVFKWFSFECTTEKSVLLPDPTTCQAGSWIGVTNISGTSDIKVFDVFGLTLHAVIPMSECAGGTSKRLLCVSSLSSATGTTVMGTRWIVA
jgi:hypothetical protein